MYADKGACSPHTITEDTTGKGSTHAEVQVWSYILAHDGNGPIASAELRLGDQVHHFNETPSMRGAELTPLRVVELSDHKSITLGR